MDVLDRYETEMQEANAQARAIKQARRAATERRIRDYLTKWPGENCADVGRAFGVTRSFVARVRAEMRQVS